MMSSQTHYYLCTGLFVIQRSWWRPPGPGLWLTCWLRCAPCSGSHSGTPLRSGRPPSRWTVFCCGFDSIFGHFARLCRRHVMCASYRAIFGPSQGPECFSREIDLFQSLYCTSDFKEVVKKLMLERLQVFFHSNQIDVISNTGKLGGKSRSWTEIYSNLSQQWISAVFRQVTIQSTLAGIWYLVW